MKKLTLISHNPEVVSQKSTAPLTLLLGGKSQESAPAVETYVLDSMATVIRSEFTGPNGQAVRLVEVAGFLIVQQLVEFGLGNNPTEWEIKTLAPATKENTAKLMLCMSELINCICSESLDATA